jgi:ubiquitin carboxyl-terminal hydrolase 25/28
LGFAYLAQCRCDPAGTAKYFSYFTHIVKALQEYGSCPPLLQELCVTEQSRDRFTLEDVNTAATVLGFGADNVLRVDYDEDVPDEFVENAWRTCVKRSWQDLQYGSETLRHANDSFRVLAETRGSVKLWQLWENGKNTFMNPDRAYQTLEVPKEVDDNMLITVYSMRVRLLLYELFVNSVC